VRLDLAHRHATGVQRDDLVIKPIPAGLMLGDQLGLKAAIAVTRHLDGQLTELAFEGLLAVAVTGGCRHWPLILGGHALNKAPAGAQPLALLRSDAS